MFNIFGLLNIHPTSTGNTHETKKTSSTNNVNDIKDTESVASDIKDAESVDGKIIFDTSTHRFNVDGEQLTLVELFYKITSRAATTAKEMLAMTVQNLDDANEDGQQALAWRNKLAALEPSGSGTTPYSQVSDAADKFKLKYGVDPIATYGLNDFKKTSGTYSKDDFEKMSKATESYISSVSNNQSKINLDVERYTHVVTEANQLIASVDKAISDVLSSIVNKIS